MVITLLKTQIERIVEPSFRKTKHATFALLNGWYICDAWFEAGEPRMQIRSGAHSLEEASIVSTGIQMAIDWLAEQIAKGESLPPADQAPGDEPARTSNERQGSQ